MPLQQDAFDEFFRRVGPLMRLYQALELTCVAAKTESDWILISGRAALTVEQPTPEVSRIPFLAKFSNFVARSGRLRTDVVDNLVSGLRGGVVIEVSKSEMIRLSAKGQSPYSWRLSGVTPAGNFVAPSNRWCREFILHGSGPNLASLLSDGAWQEIDHQLRKISPNPFKDFDSLCSKLKLPAQRGNLQGSFSLSAELPGRFRTIKTNLSGETLEADIECVGSPDLTVNWLPAHDFHRVPPGWSDESTGDHYHVSLPIPANASKAELLLSFEGFDADYQTADLPRRTTKAPELTARSSHNQEDERWRVIGKPLGQGGQGKVVRVEDALSQYQGPLAQKSLNRLNDEKARDRFGQEVKAVQSINHPNILKIVHSDLTAARPFYVAEYCEGGSLQAIGASRYKGDINAAMSVLLPIVDGVVAAHHANPSVIHRDIKPANILFRKDSTPVIGDFGICFIEGGEGLTSLGEAVGPRHFIAPEMESGGRHLGNPSDRTDVYSIGKLFYWMLSGGLYLDRERHRDNSLVNLLNDQRWDHIHSILDKMVVERPQDRLQSTQLRAELQSATSLVLGGFAPLSPSTEIRCRFCGIGSYKRAHIYGKGNAYSHFGLKGSGAGDPSGELALLTCGHCGHIEWFQLKGIECDGWWNR